MLIGAVAVSASLLCFGFSPAIVRGTLDMFGSKISEAQTQRLVMANAVLWFIVLNVAIQPLSIGTRAIIVEKCAADEQFTAHAWASRVQGLSNIAGYFLASVPLPEICLYGPLPQFPTLCLLASFFLLATVVVSCHFIREESSQFLPTIEINESRRSTNFKHLISSLQQLPKPIREICLVQCFAWMAWFPFLAYYTTYIAVIYERRSSPSPVIGQQPYNTLHQLAASPRPASLRFGSFAGLLLALVAFITTCVVPRIASFVSLFSSAKEHPAWYPDHQLDSHSGMPTSTLTKIWTFAHSYFAVAIFTITSLDLFFPVSLSSLRLTTIMALVASIGVSWAITLWVPYCLVAVELRHSQASPVFVLGDNDEDREICIDRNFDAQSQPLAEAGAVMGFHNAAISAPQIVSAMISALMFAAAKRGGEGLSLEWAMRIGGLWAIGAAVLAWRMERRPETAKKS